jgi:hypothetical protein
LGLSSTHIKPLLVGLIGSLIGILIVELAIVSQLFSKANPLIYAMVIFGIFGICLGMALETAEGFYKTHQHTILQGAKTGAVFGLVSGMVSGLVAQLVFSGILVYASLKPYTFLWSTTTNFDPSLISMIFTRTIGWCTFGFLIGLSYGIKEETFGDVKLGLISGVIAGAISGLLFDPLTLAFQIGQGISGRLFSFAILGLTVGLFFFRFKVDISQPKSGDVIIVYEEDSITSSVLFFSGVLVFIVGIFLVVGNLSGSFPTFPFAGFLTTTVGSLMISASRRM